MTREQYNVLRAALTGCAELIYCCLTAEVEALGKQHRRIRYWHRMAALVLRFADKLDDQTQRESAERLEQARRELEARLALSRVMPLGLA